MSNQTNEHTDGKTSFLDFIKYFSPSNRDNRRLEIYLRIKSKYSSYGDEKLLAVRDALSRSLENWNRLITLFLATFLAALLSGFGEKAFHWIVGVLIVQTQTSSQANNPNVVSLEDKLLVRNFAGLIIAGLVAMILLINVQIVMSLSWKKCKLQIIERIIKVRQE